MSAEIHRIRTSFRIGTIVVVQSEYGIDGDLLKNQQKLKDRVAYLREKERFAHKV